MIPRQLDSVAGYDTRVTQILTTFLDSLVVRIPGSHHVALTTIVTQWSTTTRGTRHGTSSRWCIAPSLTNRFPIVAQWIEIERIVEIVAC